MRGFRGARLSGLRGGRRAALGEESGHYAGKCGGFEARHHREGVEALRRGSGTLVLLVFSL